jgi:hypothetical protein
MMETEEVKPNCFKPEEDNPHPLTTIACHVVVSPHIDIVLPYYFYSSMTTKGY